MLPTAAEAPPPGTRGNVDGGNDNLDQIAIVTDNVHVQVGVAVLPRDQDPAAAWIPFDDLAGQDNVDDVLRTNPLFVSFPECVL